jgi:hypothetical protein
MLYAEPLQQELLTPERPPATIDFRRNIVIAPYSHIVIAVKV